MSRRGWIFLIVVFSVMMLVSLLSALIRDGRFGEDIIGYADWPVYVAGSILLILVLIFRKRILSWKDHEDQEL